MNDHPTEDDLNWILECPDCEALRAKLEATQRLLVEYDDDIGAIQAKLDIAVKALEKIAAPCEFGWAERGKCNPECDFCFCTRILADMGFTERNPEREKID